VLLLLLAQLITAPLHLLLLSRPVLLLLFWLHICTLLRSHGWLSCSIRHSCSCSRSVLMQPALPLLLLLLAAGGPAASKSSCLPELQGGLVLFRALGLRDSHQLAHAHGNPPGPWRGLLWLCWTFRCGPLLLLRDALCLFSWHCCWALLTCMPWQLLELVCICVSICNSTNLLHLLLLLRASQRLLLALLLLLGNLD
jgi:hypothetical protein